MSAQLKSKVASARPESAASRRSLIEPIPDTPENIARAIMSGPPKKKWRYTQASVTGSKGGSRR